MLHYNSVIYQECSDETVSHMLTCPPTNQQSVRLRSSIAAVRGIFPEILSDFKDGDGSDERKQEEAIEREENRQKDTE